MTVDDLLRDGRIKPITAVDRNVQDLLVISRRDIKAARNNLESSPDWALSIAYNATLQSLRAFMLSRGYRPNSDGHHEVTIEFAEMFLDGDLMLGIRRMKKNRTRSVYETANTITVEGANRAIVLAEKTLVAVEGKIATGGAKNPPLKKSTST